MSNIQLLTAVAKGLGHLCPKVVFVGGAVTELYATDNAVSEIRPTDDVDCVVELVSYSAFTQIEKELRGLNFKNDMDSNIICRWIYRGIKVDVMPDDAKIMGFSNPWYKEGIRNSIPYILEEELIIRIFSTAWFLASKMAALADRGRYNFRTSTDFEDIIFVIDSRPELAEELKTVDENVKYYIKSEFQKYLLNPGISEGIFCALPHDSGKERIEQVRKNMIRITEL